MWPFNKNKKKARLQNKEFRHATYDSSLIEDVFTAALIAENIVNTSAIDEPVTKDEPFTFTHFVPDVEHHSYSSATSDYSSSYDSSSSDCGGGGD